MDNKTLSASNLLTAQTTSVVKPLNHTADKSKAIQAAQDFEAVFITEMMKPMFESVGVDEVFGGGKGEEIFRGLMVQEYGKLFAKQGGIGLADNVTAELLKVQEHQTTGSN